MSRNHEKRWTSHRRGFLRRTGTILGTLTLGTGQTAGIPATQPQSNRQEAHEGTALHTPPAGTPDPGAMYPRVIRLDHAPGDPTVLVTFEYYRSTIPEFADTPYFPVYRSTNGGRTWSVFSEIHDTQNDWGLRYQPTLFELPNDIGPWDAGTVLAAGNSIPDDLSKTRIELYASEDHGRTWSYVSTVATGGRAVPTSGNAPIWEPELELDADDNLVCYFADERHKDQGFDQLLGHKVSADGGRTWNDQKFDVAIPDGVPGVRPGMPVVQKLPNDRYIMAYEIVGHQEGTVFVRTSPDGIDWGDPTAMGTPVRTEDGRYLANGPYVTWTPRGGDNGTVLVTGKTLRDRNGDQAARSGKTILANTDLEGDGNWTPITAPLWYEDEIDTGYVYVGWTSPLLPTRNGTQLLHLSSTYVDDLDLCEVRCAKRPLRLNEI